MEKKPSSGGRRRSTAASGGSSAAKFFSTCLSCCNLFRDDNSVAETEIPSSATTADLRLLCSYGGRLTSLDSYNPQIYRGGENRFIAVDRRCSAADLLRRLSTEFLGGRSFTLKYHISSPGLNAFISVVTDEDLRFMIEEYDRLTSSPPLFPAAGPPRPPLPPMRPLPPLPPLPPQRRYLRVFLLPASPETGALSRPVSPTVPHSSDDDDDFDEDDFDDDDDEN